MAVSTTVADVIDRNRIASGNAWLVLLDIEVKDEFDHSVETIYLVQNDEDIEFQGNTYKAASFDITSSQAANEEPSMRITAFDPTGVLRSKMEEYNGGIGFGVTVSVVNSGNLSAPAEIAETFDVTSANAPGYQVEWTLGAENPLKYQYPYREQYRDRCPWVFKGPRCKYSGPDMTCGYTQDACRAKNNLRNFGGFPSLQNRQ